MIELENVAYNYGGGELLSEISLKLQPGSFHFLTGPSGAGKTTLLKLCYGALLPTSGQVRLFTSDVRDMERDDIALARRRIGVVHQDCQFLDHLPVTENVALPLELAGADDADVRAVTALERVGLAHRLDHYPAALSGGEQQRVAFARAVVHRPSLLLADEPTGNLDRATARMISDALLGYRDETGGAVMLITHDEALARRADRLLRIEDGRILTTEPATSDAMAGAE